MEPLLGLRVVRGPDWRWDDQDGGEGCVGTVAELGREKKAVMVQWDCGITAWYRSGAVDKFDLRVLDTAPTGLKFPEVVCSGCYAEGVAGTYWKCAHCYEYHLCHSCYLLGRHCQEHPFFRVQSTKQTPRVKVSPRVDARQVEAKGTFPGAKVVRGKNWKFGDQDGSAGSIGRVTSIERWKDLSARSVAKVEWSASEKSNIYRVGHRGKVDLKCVSVGSGGHYYPEHLCTLGFGASVDLFDEDEIVAGDVITVALDPDVFRMMQEAIGIWDDNMRQVSGSCGIVLSVLKHQRLYSAFASECILYYNTATKLKHCRQGETVRVTSDLSVLHQLQSQKNIWDDGLITTLGQIGRVTKVGIINVVKVIVQGKEWLYHPLCLSPAPRESASEDIDPQSENLGMSVNMSIKTARDKFMRRGITDVALLDGDLETLSSCVYSNKTKQKMKEDLLTYYAVTGLIPALKMVLESGVDPNITHGAVSLINHCFYYNHEEACLALMNAGADIYCVPGKSKRDLRNFVIALAQGSYQFLRAIATHSGVTLDAQSDDGVTALNYASNMSNHLGVAILLAAGASPIMGNRNLIVKAGACGVVSVMETFVVYAKQHLNSTAPGSGLTAIHTAAQYNNSRVCNILASQACVDINMRESQTATPLHYAVDRASWAVVECLLGWGAQLNVTEVNGNTPLHYVVGKKSPVVPDSVQLKMVHEELSRASGVRAVEGYVAVACFLVQEGANIYIKNNKGLSSYQMMSSDMASLITAYVKNHPGSFQGSLCSTQQRLMCELPQLKLSLGADSTLSVTEANPLTGPSMNGSKLSPSFLNTTKQKTVLVDLTTQHKETHDLSAMKQQPPASASGGGSQQSQDSADPTVESPENRSKLLPSFLNLAVKEETVLVDAKIPHKDAHAFADLPAVKQQPPTSFSGGGSQQFQASADPTVESPENSSPNSQGQLCLLCEEHPASVKFSPCRHTVMCSVCAERAKRCLQCEGAVESKEHV